MEVLRSLIAILLLAFVLGCSPLHTQKAKICKETHCNCTGVDACEVPCQGGNCQVKCNETSACKVQCDGGNCDVDCTKAGSCKVLCDEKGGCQVQGNASETYVYCQAGHCEVDCKGTKACNVSCAGGQCEVNCGQACEVTCPNCQVACSNGSSALKQGGRYVCATGMTP